ncbi:MAG: DUF4173 domain-containing protein [Acidimicrobiia bacterium]|nr:DUF4173 domain-containing protein [Acidimicrobiia bacterium]
MSDPNLLLDLPPPSLPSSHLDRKPRFARPWAVVLVALAVGIVVDVLALHQPPGLGLSLGLMVGLVVTASISTVMGRPTPRSTWLILVFGLAVAAMVAVRTSPVLLSLNVGFSAALMGVLAQMHREPRLADWTVTRYLMQPFATLDGMAVGSGRLVSHDLRGSFHENQSDRLRSVWIGVLIATPLLIVFGSLFASADAVFSDRLDGLFRGILFGGVFWRLFFVLLITAATAGLWRTMRNPEAAEAVFERRQRMDLTTAITALAMLVALFAFFVATQVVGHNPELERIVDYSTNARRGFFQLVIVAFLVLNVLLYFDWMTYRDDGRRSTAFDRIAIVLIALTALVMLSALNRMRLYVDEFGLTELRFYSTAFMLWLAFVLVWFIGTVLKNRHSVFAVGLFASSLLFVLGLNAINPDAFIVQANWQRHLEGSSFSDRYNSELSLDSMPTLVAIRDASDDARWCFIESRLTEERERLATYRSQHGILGDSWAAQRGRELLGQIDVADANSQPCPDPRSGG